MDVELGADKQSDCGTEPRVRLQNLRFKFSIKFSIVSSGRLQNLWRLLLYHEGGLDEGVEEDVEPVRQLGQDVHARLLARDVQPLVDHLQLPDLLPIQPNNLGKVFAPE